jgi:hypothetical protein
MRLVLGADHPGTKDFARDAKKCRVDCQVKRDTVSSVVRAP